VRYESELKEQYEEAIKKAKFLIVLQIPDQFKARKKKDEGSVGLN
jgi:predicted protein tyrosine phosphatase